jgi:hypothetical protein
VTQVETPLTVLTLSSSATEPVDIERDRATRLVCTNLRIGNHAVVWISHRTADVPDLERGLIEHHGRRPSLHHSTNYMTIGEPTAALDSEDDVHLLSAQDNVPWQALAVTAIGAQVVHTAGSGKTSSLLSYLAAFAGVAAALSSQHRPRPPDVVRLARLVPLAPQRFGAAPVLPVSPPALAAYDEIRSWLSLSQEDMDALTGIGKTTAHYWRHAGALARPSTVRRLWRVHALLTTLRRAADDEGALTWLRLGSPSPLELLLAGRVRDVEALMHRVAFRQPELRVREFSGVRLEDYPYPTESSDATMPGVADAPPSRD